MTRLFAFIAAICLCTATAQASPPPPEVKARFDAPALRGSASTRAWGIKLFDAQLWLDRPGAFSFSRPFALSLTYGWRFSREDIANSTVAEIIRVEGGAATSHSALRDQIAACIPDVRRGLRITGVPESATRVTLYVQGRKSCTLRYPDLRKRFFSIWLAPTSRDSRAAARLTGRG